MHYALILPTKRAGANPEAFDLDETDTDRAVRKLERLHDEVLVGRASTAAVH